MLRVRGAASLVGKKLRTASSSLQQRGARRNLSGGDAHHDHEEHVAVAKAWQQRTYMALVRC